MKLKGLKELFDLFLISTSTFFLYIYIYIYIYIYSLTTTSIPETHFW